MMPARTSGIIVDAKSLSKKLCGIAHSMGMIRTKSSSRNDSQFTSASKASGYDTKGSVHGNAFCI